MRNIPKSQTYNLLVLLTSAVDHVTGIENATLSVQICKSNAVFSSISPTITDLGYGWYKIQLTSSVTDTDGDLALHITAAGADPCDLLCVVGTQTQVQALNVQGYTSVRSEKLDDIDNVANISTAVWANPFVTKLLTVAKFLGLK